jgi:predicted RNA binding protein YcfA (HicA-like mRNA interferase family)
LTAADAERLLLQSGYKWIRCKGSHRIYLRGQTRVVIPFHGNRILHPKIVRQVEQAINAT